MCENSRFAAASIKDAESGNGGSLMKQDGSVFTLENEELLVTIDRRGAELTGIYDKKAGREILWKADPSVWGRHAPILFPFVGKSFEGKYLCDGTEYEIMPHGFARDMEFEPVLCDMDECWYRLKDTPKTYAVYPFHFELEVGHRLTGRVIEVIWRVVNPDSGELLFMIGGHPAFQTPQGKTIYDYTLSFNKERSGAEESAQQLHYLAPNENGYQEERRSGTLQLKDGQVPITKGFFDTALTYMFDDGQVSSVGLLVDGKPYVTVSCGGFPYLGVWTMEATHPFVCLEPWYGICAPDGYAGELKDRPGMQKLNAWGTWE